MTRYCFTSQPSDNVRQMFRNANIKLTEQTRDEYCFVSDDQSLRYAVRDAVNTPDWKVIKTIGPFVTEDHYVQQFPQIQKLDGTLYDLNKRAELALFSYASIQNKTKAVHDNFAESFSRITGGTDIEDLDLSVFDDARIDLPSSADEHGYVYIDGEPVNLTNYTTPVTTVAFNGRIIMGISRQDVIVNSSVKVLGFKTENAPGSSWSAKWMVNGQWSFTRIQFDDNESGEESLSEEEGSEGESSSGQTASQYGSEEEEEEGAFFRGRQTEYEYAPEFEETAEPATSRRDFALLTERERYLPLSYVIPVLDQWKIILKSLESNFTNTRYLPKVSDRTISIINDVVSYSDSLGNRMPKAAHLLQTYAKKRLSM